MKRLITLSHTLIFTCAAAMSLSACGAPEGVMSADPDALQNQQALDAPEVCEAVHAKIVAGRANLQMTPEWKALEKTPEYKAVDTTGGELQKVCKGHDAENAPSAQCAATFVRFKADLAAMKATPQWAGVETVPAYAALKDTYDEYKAKGCSHLSSADDAEII